MGIQKKYITVYDPLRLNMALALQGLETYIHLCRYQAAYHIQSGGQ